jgi:hypothetical protein
MTYRSESSTSTACLKATQYCSTSGRHYFRMLWNETSCVHRPALGTTSVCHLLSSVVIDPHLHPNATNLLVVLIVAIEKGQPSASLSY